MFNDMNPAVKQMWIFSLIISFIITTIINFTVIEFLKGSFAYGFPINMNGVTGIAWFIDKIINIIIQGLILTPVTFYTVKYLQTRVRI